MMEVRDHHRELRSHYERLAATLFGVCGLFLAVICGGIIVSGWFAGVMTDQYERVFWAGAIISGLAVTVLAVASMPFGGNDRAAVVRIRVLATAGPLLFIVAALLCVGSMIADFFF